MSKTVINHVPLSQQIYQLQNKKEMGSSLMKFQKNLFQVENEYQIENSNEFSGGTQDEI